MASPVLVYSMLRESPQTRYPGCCIKVVRVGCSRDGWVSSPPSLLLLNALDGVLWSAGVFSLLFVTWLGGGNSPLGC